MEIESIKSTGYQGSTSSASVTPVTSAQEVASSANGNAEAKVKIVNTNSQNNLDTKADNLSQAEKEQIKKSISEINSKLNRNTECVFGIHEETNRVTIKIIDRESKEVLKEIPPEKTLEMIAKIWEFAGILVDEKV